MDKKTNQPFQEKRKKPRNVEEDQRYYIEMVLTYPKSTRFRKEIIDLNDSGLSFRMPIEEGYFLPGTPLKDIKIIKGKEIEEIEYGEVVYVCEVNGNSHDHKIGIAFKKIVKDYATYKRNLKVFEKRESEKRRSSRYRIDHPVRIESEDRRDELVGTALNVSQRGLVVETPHDLLIDLKLNIIFTELSFNREFTGRVLWSAPAEKEGYYHVAIVFDEPLEEISIFGNYPEINNILPEKEEFIAESLVKKGMRLNDNGKRWIKRTRSLFFRIVSSAPSNHIIVNGKELINFNSYNYLGLSIHPKVKEAMIKAVKKYGTGAGSVPVISTMDLHDELESRLEGIEGNKSVCIFPTGFITNVYFLLTLLDGESIIICDEKAHASIMDGAVLSGGVLRIFRHNDMKDLERILESYPKDIKKLIAVDGVYSMDGDICNLPDIHNLARKYNASVMVDEAHAIGVMGNKGYGVVEHFGLQGKIDFIIGSLSKGLGAIGGYVACNKDIKIFLKTCARANMFSTSLPPALCAGLITAIDVMEKEPELKKRLWHNIDLIKGGLKDFGYNVGNTESAIIPVIIGHEIKTYQIARILHDKYNIFVHPVTRPGVPRGSSRLRVCMTAMHTDDNINYALDAFKKLKKRFL